jgi:hypothetical protein
MYILLGMYNLTFSNDDYNFYIDKKVADQSEYLKNRIFMKSPISSEEPTFTTTIKLEEVRGEILSIIVDYLNHKVNRI